MKLDTTTDTVVTQPLNANLSFREELAKLQEQSEQPNNETATEERIETDTGTDGSSDEHELSDKGDSADSDGRNSDNDSDDDDFGDNQPLIPRKRLNKEIEKKRTMEAKYLQEREDKIRYQTELEMINKALAQVSQPQQSQGSPKQEQFQPLDDEAHQFYSQKYSAQDEKIAALQQEIERTRFESALNQHHQSFVKQAPDFDEAYQFLMKTEIEATKVFARDEEQAQLLAMQKLRSIAEGSLNNGKNAAEVFYKMAKSYGFSAKPSKPTPNLDAIANNMRKSKVADVSTAPLSPSNGGGNYNTLEQFDKLYTGNTKENRDRFHAALKAIQQNR
jgi:hypothetical protein